MSRVPARESTQHRSRSKLPNRLIRMFSFVGDTVVDPFLGSGTSTSAAMACGRNSIGVEIEPSYLESAASRLAKVPFGVSLTIER